MAISAHQIALLNFCEHDFSFATLHKMCYIAQLLTANMIEIHAFRWKGLLAISTRRNSLELKNFLN